MNRQIHIAMLIGSLTRGGAERVMVNLADDFAKKGYLVTMVTQYQKENEYPLNPAVKRVISDITPEETGSSRVLNFVRRFTKLRGIWKKERPDVILSFIGKNNMMAILTSRFLGIPVAVSVRAEPGEEYYTSWMRFAARHLFARAEGVILQTRRCFDFFPEKVRKKAVILRNPVSNTFFRERYEGEREPVIVAVGRVDENKNHILLIKAFADVAEKFPQYRLVIYGEGECRGKLLDFVKAQGLQERVFLPGETGQVAEAIFKARAFVLCSNSEGVPNTLIEAMLMGLTVISTDCPCGGPGELIGHGVNGLLTPVGDQEKLREALEQVMGDPEMADALGKEAARIREDYGTETVYGSWERYLGGLVRKGRGH